MKEESVFEAIRLIGDKFYDGHFTIMKFTTGYRVSFGGQPDGREDIQQMPAGDTLGEAIVAALKHEGWIVGEGNTPDNVMLKVLPNTATGKIACPLCGMSEKPHPVPYWFFINGNPDEPVCWICAKRNDAHLFNVVKDANIKHWADLTK